MKIGILRLKASYWYKIQPFELKLTFVRLKFYLLISKLTLWDQKKKKKSFGLKSTNIIKLKR